MNKLLDKIIAERKGIYCHVLEVANNQELESIIESTIHAYGDEDFTDEDYIDFFNSAELYYFTTEEENKQDEEDIYNFNFDEYIRGTV